MTCRPNYRRMGPTPLVGRSVHRRKHRVRVPRRSPKRSPTIPCPLPRILAKSKFASMKSPVLTRFSNSPDGRETAAGRYCGVLATISACCARPGGLRRPSVVVGLGAETAYRSPRPSIPVHSVRSVTCPFDRVRVPESVSWFVRRAHGISARALMGLAGGRRRRTVADRREAARECCGGVREGLRTVMKSENEFSIAKDGRRRSYLIRRDSASNDLIYDNCPGASTSPSGFAAPQPAIVYVWGPRVVEKH